MRTAIAMTNLLHQKQNPKKSPSFPFTQAKTSTPKKQTSQTQNARNNPDLKKEHKNTQTNAHTEERKKKQRRRRNPKEPPSFPFTHAKHPHPEFFL
jgi:hypothetical protein